VNEDHEPYCCISEQCFEAQPRFVTSRQWLEHMLKDHGYDWHRSICPPQSWVCPLCNSEDTTYTTSHQLTSHVMDSHGDIFTHLQIQAIVRQSRTQTLRPKNECPLCCLPIEDQQRFLSAKDIQDKKVDIASSETSDDEDLNRKPKRTKLTADHEISEQPVIPSADQQRANFETHSATSSLKHPTAEPIDSHVAGHLQAIMALTLRLISTDAATDILEEDQSFNSDSDEQSSRLNSALSNFDLNVDGVKNGMVLTFNDTGPNHATDQHAIINVENQPRWRDLFPASPAPELDDFLIGVIASGAFQSHMTGGARKFARDQYHVGIICARPMEVAAVKLTLDNEHGSLVRTDWDSNTYTFGRIGGINVVVACLPAGVSTNMSAASVATDMMRSFSIKFGLMVGIGGGVWSEKTDVRLGDVVVNQPNGMHSGVVQWDCGKMKTDGLFRSTATLVRPPHLLLKASRSLKERHKPEGGEINDHLQRVFEKCWPQLANNFQHQGQEHDELFEADYGHSNGDTCADCDRSRLVRIRPRRTDDHPRIHYGNIASGDQVVKDGLTRDRIARQESIICFETEAADLMSAFPCMVIRGVCDYADSHQNDRWQPYAAVSAACYAKALLEEVNAARVEPTSEQSLSIIAKRFGVSRPILTHDRLSSSIQYQRLAFPS